MVVFTEFPQQNIKVAMLEKRKKKKSQQLADFCVSLQKVQMQVIGWFTQVNEHLTILSTKYGLCTFQLELLNCYKE